MRYDKITKLLIKEGFRSKEKLDVMLDEDEQFRLRVLAEEIAGYSLNRQDFIDEGYMSTDRTPVTLGYLDQCRLNSYIYWSQYPFENQLEAC